MKISYTTRTAAGRSQGQSFVAMSTLAFLHLQKSVLAFGVNRHLLLRTPVVVSTYRSSSLRYSSTLLKKEDITIPLDIGYSDPFEAPSRTENKFEVTSPYEPTGDQPEAIDQLVQQVSRGDKFSILRGITGTGKTNVMAHTIARLGRPTLVLCHNKTLAAQLARELRACLSNNHVQLFVSYYNHYVPESYNEVSNKYTAKKSSINDELDALRHLATRALVQHKDVVIVASVSCIYGMGMPKSYLEASLKWTVDETSFESLDDITGAMQATVYTPCQTDDDDLSRGQFQLSHNSTGATLALWPPSEAYPMRVDFLHHIDGSYRLSSIAHGHTTGMKKVSETTIFPAKHHLTESPEQFEEALTRIQDELQDRLLELKDEGKLLEADRLAKRVSQDLQLLRETGTCSGVENYSRHMALREAGQAPDTLLDYFRSDDWLLMVDESHVALPQLKAMYGGDQSRKRRLVKHGFRLPSALDNRPLKETEFWKRISQGVFVSATPSKLELSLIEGVNDPVDMVIRPTFVCDPEIHVRPPKGQLDDLLGEIQERAKSGERTLAMALTKRDAEDLADYLIEQGVSATYIHSGLNTHDRSDALKALQSGRIDCLVGVNLLREGLDLPQVSLVAVLNADSEGFLRSETALLQTIGRAARNIRGTAVLYANRVTDSMKKCIDATSRRRAVQLAYNAKHGKKMKSTEGSSVLSIFDLLKDQIEAEQPIEVIKSSTFQKTSVDLMEHLVDGKVKASNGSAADIETDHLPSKPGVYFWKDANDNILYIGKAKRLRSRVKSYLSPKARHTKRIETMISKAESVEFILTPSDRDALLLESNLIKHHQPLYNVLLKDDEAYPYICASIGESFPQLTIAPRKAEGDRAAKYRYFGPYPHYGEINSILQAIEEKYDLRSKSFQARYGEVSKTEYHDLFQRVLEEVFEKQAEHDESSLLAKRLEFEEASDLFESPYNQCRDVIAVAKSDTDGDANHIVHVLQLREGLIAGQFSYTFKVHSGLNSEEDYGDAIQTILEKRHYPSGASGHRFPFFPKEILLQYPVESTKSLRDIIRASQKAVDIGYESSRLTIRVAATKGARFKTDQRALQCAIENAKQVSMNRSMMEVRGVPPSSIDGSAEVELADLLSLENPPKRIECYDISHTQGKETVASRVVFVDGRPAKHLYRRFNIQSVDGIDDYASIEEVMERRFKRAWKDGGHEPILDSSDPWSLPDLVVIDGGKGQLSAAMKGMQKSNVVPFFKRTDTEWASNEGNFLTEEEAFKTDHDTLDKQHPSAIIPIVSLAKENEEVFTVGLSNPINDSPDSPALLLLRALRDESHRFALSSHRKRRTKANGL